MKKIYILLPLLMAGRRYLSSSQEDSSALPWNNFILDSEYEIFVNGKRIFDEISAKYFLNSPILSARGRGASLNTALGKP